MSAVPAGTLISSMFVARNCSSTVERREKSGISRRSSALVVTDRSLAWSASYHAPRYWYAMGLGHDQCRLPGEDLTRLRHGFNVLWSLRSRSGATTDKKEPSDADQSSVRSRWEAKRRRSRRASWPSPQAITTRHSERGTRMRVGIRRFLSATHNARHARVPVTLVACLVVVFALVTGAGAGGVVGTSFPTDFPVIIDASLGVPIIGFGAGGRVERTPVIFVHGNNDTPFPTACNPFGSVHAFAQFFANQGYSPSELWGLGYQGDQCDLIQDQTIRSSKAHSTVANVPDLRQFVQAVLVYTRAKQIDIVAH